MGIYFDHGIEYYVINGEKKIVLVNTKQSDERLLKSQYYLEREEGWLSVISMAPKECDPDIELTDVEKSRLNLLLSIYPNAKHGWYEVASYTSSLE